MEYGFYLSPRVGSGTLHDPYRSKITSWMQADGTGQNYWDWIHPDRPVRYGLVYADTAVHDQLAADSQIIALSPRFSDVAAAEAWLGHLGTTFPAAIQAMLRLDGCAPEQGPQGGTVRDLFSQLRAMHVSRSRPQDFTSEQQAADSPRMRLGPLEF